jgi:DsbC/DsbD-like thiol-disulfide interchange protein
MVYAHRSSFCWFAIFVASLVVNAALIAPCWAADASPWDGDQRSAVRLIAGSALNVSDGRTLRGGTEVRLMKGWKTYWRYPGDAGVPPRFDFAGSENINAITVLWPAPQRFSEDGINLIGYEGDVILPLRITPEDHRKAVTLHLKLDYGICEKLCIPADAKVELVLSGDAGSHEIALAAAEARVKPVEIGHGNTLAIQNIQREVGTTTPRIVVDIAAPAATRVDLFVEGPTPDWALPLPEPAASSRGLHLFAFELSGVLSGAKPDGSVLKFTAVGDDEAIEVSAPLH